MKPDPVYEKIKAHMKWDDAKTQLWYLTPNPLCGGISPNQFMAMRPEKFEKWVDGLIAGEGP